MFFSIITDFFAFIDSLPTVGTVAIKRDSFLNAMVQTIPSICVMPPPARVNIYILVLTGVYLTAIPADTIRTPGMLLLNLILSAYAFIQHLIADRTTPSDFHCEGLKMRVRIVFRILIICCICRFDNRLMCAGVFLSAVLTDFFVVPVMIPIIGVGFHIVFRNLLSAQAAFCDSVLVMFALWVEKPGAYLRMETA